MGEPDREDGWGQHYELCYDVIGSQEVAFDFDFGLLREIAVRQSPHPTLGHEQGLFDDDTESPRI
jgi:hypothetical protein